MAAIAEVASVPDQWRGTEQPEVSDGVLHNAGYCVYRFSIQYPPQGVGREKPLTLYHKRNKLK